jgi:signal transduction histidine kinase/CheY-like chemotaxis protein
VTRKTSRAEPRAKSAREEGSTAPASAAEQKAVSAAAPLTLDLVEETGPTPAPAATTPVTAQPAGAAEPARDRRRKDAPARRGESPASADYAETRPRVALGDRLTRISRLTLSTAVAIVALLISVSSFVLGTYNLVDTTRVQARVLADGAAAAVLLQDEGAAQELLKALRNAPDVITCALYGRDGRMFTTYHKERPVNVPPDLDVRYERVEIGLSHVDLSVPISAHGGADGSLYISVGLQGLYRQLAIQLIATLVATMTALTISRGLVQRLLVRSVLQPLSGLTRVMTRVSGETDFRLRAMASDITELDDLARGFNAMIETIEEHDRQLAARHEDLEEQVAARTTDLVKARDAAEMASRAKSDFLATMSHEIRTPLNGVLGMNELLLASDLQPAQRNWALAVQNSGQHLVSVILDFSKIESGHMQLETVDFSLLEVVEDALAMFSQPASQKGLVLAARFKPDAASMPWLRGDPLRLRQVLANLLSNAIKFTEAGEVIVEVITRHESNSVESISICVADTGVGIPEAAQAKLFEQFSQADSTTTRRYGGTGLGLAICRNLLKLMGGSIRLESAPGHGTRFFINVQLPKAQVSRQEKFATMTLDGTRVLICDDNDTNRAILRQQLEGWSMRVTAARSGEEALAILAKAAGGPDAFQMAIIDMQMPGMDGVQLAAAISARPATSKLPVLMLSSNSGMVPPTAADGTIQSYLTKPVRRADLFRAVCALLGESTSKVVTGIYPQQETRGALRGRVLLVEDNEINQEVAGAMLGALGLDYVVAGNGRDAIAKVAAESFDLVLMDCQMPVMDGFEAARAIRQLPGARGERLPIIAVTANAMQGDEKRCLDAGMDGFVAKPYTFHSFRAGLARWLPGSSGAPTLVLPKLLTETVRLSRTPSSPAHAVAAPAASPPAPGAPVSAAAAPDAVSSINPQAIEAMRALDRNRGSDLVKKVVSLFISSSGDSLQKITRAIDAEDGQQLAQLTHALKSSAANVGAQALSRIYGELEILGRTGRIAEARQRLPELTVEHERAVTVMRQICQESA